MGDMVVGSPSTVGLGVRLEEAEGAAGQARRTPECASRLFLRGTIRFKPRHSALEEKQSSHHRSHSATEVMTHEYTESCSLILSLIWGTGRKD